MLNSRRLFEQYVSDINLQLLNGPFAVVMIGIDHFASINEVYGYDVGDEVLDLSRDRLQSGLRDTDRLVSLPGDAFVLLLRSTESPHEIHAVTERINSLLKQPYFIRGKVLNISACIGVVNSFQSGTSSETLLKRASIALRAAKSQGAGTIHFFEGAMEDHIATRQTLATDLRKALLLRQLEVHYQPQVDVKSRRLIGFEALLRWRHPQLGMIAPGDFITLAEENGMIATIGDWVLRTACRQAANLPESLVIAVNASPLQFTGASFVTSVERALDVSKLAASRLEIEITEGLLLKNSQPVLEILNHLHNRGVRLAMDDFGTGYSSLSQLAKLPFDTIKIDRSLIGNSSKQKAIVRSIAVLGAGIGMSVLAEGIETAQELEDIHLAGCHSAQGYLFGKAVSAKEVVPLAHRLLHEIDGQELT